MADDTKQPEQDEIAKIFASSPHIHVVEDGDPEVWLLNGDAVKIANDAVAAAKRS